MMSRLRRLLENWVVRVLFVLLLLVFVFWGISNVLTLIGSDSAVAHVAGQPVDISVLQAEYQKQLAQAAQNGQTQPDIAARAQIAQSAMTTVLRQQVLQIEAQRLRVNVPDSVLRQNITGVPAFQTGGVFDQARFAALLQQNNSSPDQFLALMRRDIAANQIISGIVAGIAPPQLLSQRIFAFISERRQASSVEIPAAAQQAPVLPPDAVLQRYWRNHPELFGLPEYRQAKIVILSPQTLAPAQPVSAGELQAAYAAGYGRQTTTATRSVRVITAQDAPSAAKLAALWNAGAGWGAMQAAAAKAGGSGVEISNATPIQIPSPALAKAVFAAPPGRVGGPLQAGFGYFVYEVTAIANGGPPPLASVAAQLTRQIQLRKAQAQVDQDVNNVQDALAGQAGLDNLPGNLGLVAVEGTLDAQGKTQDGSPAPIPGGDALRQAIVKAIFAGHPGDPAQLVGGPDNGYFAFTLDSIAPAAVQPYEDARQRVTIAWIQNALQREAEVKAVALLNAVENGQSLAAAAASSGYPVSTLPPLTRNAPPAGIPAGLAQILFGLKPGEATMVQNPDGFTVAALSAIFRPDPQQDPADFAEVVQAMTKGLEDDTVASFVAGLQARDEIRVDGKLYAQVYQ